MSPQLSRLRRVAYVAFFSVIVGFFVITASREIERDSRLALVSLKHFEMLWRVRTSFGFVHCGFHGFRGPIEDGANAS